MPGVMHTCARSTACLLKFFWDTSIECKSLIPVQNVRASYCPCTQVIAVSFHSMDLLAAK